MRSMVEGQRDQSSGRPVACGKGSVLPRLPLHHFVVPLPGRAREDFGSSATASYHCIISFG